MPITMDAMTGSKLKRHLAQLYLMMFATMQLQVTVTAVPVEENTDNTKIYYDDDSCVCIPFYLCVDDTINDNGEYILDIRSSSNICEDKQDVCCKIVKNWRKADEPNPKKNINCGHWNPDGVMLGKTGNTNHNNNSKEAKFGEFPWMMAIINLNPSTKIQTNVCGGSLIHPKVVLTAAHCLNKINQDDLVIRAGEWDTRNKNEMFKHQDRQVLKIINHEQFEPNPSINDVALIIVTEPFLIGNHVSCACLPSQDFVFPIQKCYASGWGKNKFNEPVEHAKILKKIDLSIVPRDSCLKLLRTTRLSKDFQLHESFICAGGEVGKDVCTGDGGGPLMCPIDEKSRHYVQAGIVAWGIGCASKIPGVFANVAMFRNWIDQQMKNEDLETKYYDLKSDTNTPTY